MIRELFPGNRLEPVEYVYDDPVTCLNCPAEYDLEHEGSEIFPVGCDAQNHELYLCIDCRPGFRCSACGHLGIQPAVEIGFERYGIDCRCAEKQFARLAGRMAA